MSTKHIGSDEENKNDSIQTPEVSFPASSTYQIENNKPLDEFSKTLFKIAFPSETPNQNEGSDCLYKSEPLLSPKRSTSSNQFLIKEDERSLNDTEIPSTVVDTILSVINYSELVICKRKILGLYPHLKNNKKFEELIEEKMIVMLEHQELLIKNLKQDLKIKCESSEFIQMNMNKNYNQNTNYSCSWGKKNQKRIFPKITSKRTKSEQIWKSNVLSSDISEQGVKFEANPKKSGDGVEFQYELDDIHNFIKLDETSQSKIFFDTAMELLPEVINSWRAHYITWINNNLIIKNSLKLYVLVRMIYASRNQIPSKIVEKLSQQIQIISMSSEKDEIFLEEVIKTVSVVFLEIPLEFSNEKKNEDADKYKKCFRIHYEKVMNAPSDKLKEKIKELGSKFLNNYPHHICFGRILEKQLSINSRIKASLKKNRALLALLIEFMNQRKMQDGLNHLKEMIGSRFYKYLASNRGRKASKNKALKIIN